MGEDETNTLITETLLDSPAEVRRIKDQIIRYIKYMANIQKLAHSTIPVLLYAVFNFYTINSESKSSLHFQIHTREKKEYKEKLPTHTNKYFI
ncbi:MAG TPA: hypothetical protein VD694_07035 [Nitrososphaeraceae archaeon]|nr:hypothetical protein [Nitrososphaeraceae archaeon]